MPHSLDVPLHQPEISANYVLILLDYLQEKASVDADHFLVGLGLDRDLVAREDSMVPMATFLMLMEEAAAYVGDPNLGLHYYEDLNFQDIGIFGYAVLNAGTLGEAFALASRYYCLFQSDVELKVSTSGDTAELSYQITARSLPYSRQDSEMTIAALVSMARLFLGTDWQPDLVCFQHAAPADTGEHHRLLCPRVHFNQPLNKFSFPITLLDAPVSSADAKLSRSLQATLDQLLTLSQLPSENDWLKALQEQIIERLSDGVPGIEDIAGQLHMSGRTLQRKLQKEGLGFKDLVENVRHQLATNYLSASRLSMQDIAFLLGYSELSSFHRAFKRWTGNSPAEYRKRHRSQEESSSQEA